MEAMGGACILDGEWESLYKSFSSDPDLDFEDMFSHSTADHLPQDEALISLLTGDPNPVASLSDLGAPFCTQQVIPTSIVNHLSQSSSSSASDLRGSSSGSAGYVNTLNQLTQQLLNNDDQVSSLEPFDFLLGNGLLVGQFPLIEGPKSDLMDGVDDLSSNRPLAKRKCRNHQIEMEDEEAPVQPKKRPRASKNANKGKIKVQPNKNQDELGGAEEGTNGGSSCEISDNELNVSQEMINGKKGAGRETATDPQSLYARRRRERINERLRILQTLVPNGTKVDISTMLEEAVHYVKFLQLQIKLLSSDEMWMYAPLAYNGSDVGRLYNTFSPYHLQ